MTIKELRIRLINIDKSLRWLAGELGYSASYLYQVIHSENKKELERVEKILIKYESEE